MGGGGGGGVTRGRGGGGAGGGEPGRRETIGEGERERESWADGVRREWCVLVRGRSEGG
jgi:hypothetical protein